MMSASPSLVALAKSYEITRKRAPRSIADLPSRPCGGGIRAPVEVAGVRFVGYERVRVHAERGAVNDHVHGAFARRLSRHGPQPLKIAMRWRDRVMPPTTAA